ncbi:MAG TPA: hypothetical protein VK348_09075, partial [Planctomycetota bacterium]|nr:hypothetical protein [Planctomycetota bacterium]
VRYQLPLGADGAGRRLPFEHAVLASRSRDPANGCWFCDADLGVLLRAIWRAGGADAGLAAAFDQLAGDEARVATWTRQLLGAAAALPDLPAAVRCGLPAFHLHGRVRRLLQGCWAAFRGTARSAPRSVPAGGGLSIALVGCDGAGKSSVGRELGRWLATELRVERVYLGSGQGTSSLLRWPMLLVHRLIHRRVAGNRAPVTAAAAARRSWLRRLLRPVWALVLAREKQQKLRCVWRTRHAGAIVICDRYPQNEIMDYNDGPLLSHWRTDRHVWRRALARWERRPYEWAQLHPPDLVLKLRVSAGVALARKPDTSAAEVARRTAALDTLQFGHATRTVVIDADAPLQQVLRAAKAAILAEL